MWSWADFSESLLTFVALLLVLLLQLQQVLHLLLHQGTAKGVVSKVAVRRVRALCDFEQDVAPQR